MLKRALIVLEDHMYSRAAIEYGVHLATPGGITLAGLSVVDVPSIEKSIGPIPVGGTYYALREEDQRIGEEKSKISKVDAEFQNLCKEKDVPHICVLREGNGAQLILDESRYNDLLIMGYTTSISYGRALDKGKTLQHYIVSHGITSTLLIPSIFRPINKVLLCYDGSIQATKTIHEFVRLGLHKDREVTLLTVQKRENQEACSYLLKRMGEYLQSCYQLQFNSVCLHGHPHEIIPQYAAQENMDMIVIGAFGKQTLHHFFFGGTVDAFLTRSDTPIFVFH